MLGPWFVMLYFVSVLYVILPSSLWVREGALLTFIVFLISCCSHRSASSLRSNFPFGHSKHSNGGCFCGVCVWGGGNRSMLSGFNLI